MIELYYALPENLRQQVVQGLQKEWHCAQCGRIFVRLPGQQEFQCPDCGCKKLRFGY